MILSIGEGKKKNDRSHLEGAPFGCCSVTRAILHTIIA